jgi:hypothetical protein
MGGRQPNRPIFLTMKRSTRIHFCVDQSPWTEAGLCQCAVGVRERCIAKVLRCVGVMQARLTPSLPNHTRERNKRTMATKKLNRPIKIAEWRRSPD